MSVPKTYPFSDGRIQTKPTGITTKGVSGRDVLLEDQTGTSSIPTFSLVLDGSYQYDPITHVASRIARAEKAAIDHVDRTSLQWGLLGIFCHWPHYFDVLLCRTVTIVLRLSRPPPDFLLVPNRELDIERNFLISRNLKHF